MSTTARTDGRLFFCTVALLALCGGGCGQGASPEAAADARLAWSDLPVCLFTLPKAYDQFYLPVAGDLDEAAPRVVADPSARGTRASIRAAEQVRARSAGFALLLEELADLNDWKRMAVVELPQITLGGGGGLFGPETDEQPDFGFIMLVQNDDGYLYMTNVSRELGGQFRRWGTGGRTSRFAAYAPEDARRFFREMSDCRLPQMALVEDDAIGAGFSTLHVFEPGPDGRPRRTWHCMVSGQDVMDYLYGPISSTARQEEVATLLAAARPPGPGGPIDLAIPGPQYVSTARRIRDEYDRLFALFSVATVNNSARQGRPNIDRFIARIQSLDSVGGASVGYGGEPSEFWMLSDELLQWGRREDFEYLLSHEDVKVRAMGLYTLTVADWDHRAPVLRSRIEGREQFTCFPAGCVGERLTEGQLAYRLLHNSSYLGGSTNGGPVLSPRELLDLNMAIITRPDSTNARDAGAFIVRAINVWMVGQEPPR